MSNRKGGEDMSENESLSLSDDFYNLSLNQVIKEIAKMLLGDLKTELEPELEPDVIRFSAKKGIKMTLKWERLKCLVSIKKDKEGQFRVVTFDLR